jgi:hypothetical protein
LKIKNLLKNGGKIYEVQKIEINFWKKIIKLKNLSQNGGKI